ncbi:phenylalanine ammonium lyase [Peniophora sp. CONT]|nr:phenylalanine ammonium lyase [Peniophora sp. CONT]
MQSAKRAPEVNGYKEPGYKTQRTPADLVSRFIEQWRELEQYKSGKTIVVDGQSLSIAAVVATARYSAGVALDDSPEARARVDKSRKVIVDAVAAARSVYGVSTGFGGSADTRTDNTIALGHALLQHHHTGILPSAPRIHDVLPLSDPLAVTAMPEAWVRGAVLVRANSLVRGHSAVRWELLERMAALLREDITPFVPLRGSISASGDLTPLSYIAGAITGNPSIRVYAGPRTPHGREVQRAPDALATAGLAPLPLLAKEHLGIMNGTAFSAALGALVAHDAAHLALLAQVLTALGTEALLGVRANYAPFIHEVARPHPGQVEAARTIWDLLEDSPLSFGHEKDVSIDEDRGELRQDRYPLRTAPQFLGPQLEDISAALTTLTTECNSTTDNPLFDGETGEVHHGGNFQAMAVTGAMEKTRLALAAIGKLLFAQSTELVNPAMNRGLPPSLAASDPSLNYHAKGLDIATAAYTAELGYLANPVSTHIQSAEMHNQAVNSLALISARATLTATEVLSMLSATYLYLLCQAIDLRAMQADFDAGLQRIVREELATHFSAYADAEGLLLPRVLPAMRAALDTTGTMDASDRMTAVAAAAAPVLLDALAGSSCPLDAIAGFRSSAASRATTLLQTLRTEYLEGKRGRAPGAHLLKRTRPVYEFVRNKLGVRMHGAENAGLFPNGLGMDAPSIGENVSKIYEAIRDGEVQSVVVGLFA